MDSLPTDLCFMILEHIDTIDYSVWCQLSSRYYEIFHQFLKRHCEKIEDIIVQLCWKGNLDYIKYLRTLHNCKKCLRYEGISIDDSAEQLYESIPIIAAVQCGRADIVRWYMRQYPEGIRLVVCAYELPNSTKLMKHIKQLLAIDNLYLTNIASAVSRMSEYYDNNTPQDIINEHINFARSLIERKDGKIDQNDINCLGIVIHVLGLRRDKSRPSITKDKK